MLFNEQIAKLQYMIDKSSNIVFFGGAGVSTESGIPDFRSADGIFHQKYKYSPEEIVSHSFFVQHTEAFYEFYKEKMLISNVQPNTAHLALAALERAGKLKAVITQNIDGLHQAAGSELVYELHGSIHRNYCMKCKKFYDVDYIKNAHAVPHCHCGGIIKPDVVLYEESLNEEIIKKSTLVMANADMLIIGGTSLVVYPAAAFIDYFSGTYLAVINKSETAKTLKTDVSIAGSIGEVLGMIRI